MACGDQHGYNSKNLHSNHSSPCNWCQHSSTSCLSQLHSTHSQAVYTWISKLGHNLSLETLGSMKQGSKQRSSSRMISSTCLRWNLHLLQQHSLLIHLYNPSSSNTRLLVISHLLHPPLLSLLMSNNFQALLNLWLSNRMFCHKQLHRSLPRLCKQACHLSCNSIISSSSSLNSSYICDNNKSRVSGHSQKLPQGLMT